MPMAVLFPKQNPWAWHRPAASRETQQAADGQELAKGSLLACSRSFPGFEVTLFPFLLHTEEFGAFLFKPYFLSKFFGEAELVAATLFFLSLSLNLVNFHKSFNLF